MSGTGVTQPTTIAEPVVDTIGGIRFEDPYRWLEEDTPDVLAWQAAQDAHTLEHLGAWPHAAALRDAVTPLVALTLSFAPRRHGPHWFELRLRGEGTTLVVSDEPTGSGRVLIDSAALSDERGTASLDWYAPSPDGRHVAYGVSWGGDEQSVGHVVEVASGRVLEERIPFMSLAVIAWLPDGSGFYYNAGRRPDFEDATKWLFLHRLGQREQSPPEDLTVREAYCVAPQVSADGRYLAAVTSEMDVRADFVKELPDGPWRPFLVDVPEYCYGVFEGDRYIAISMAHHPRGRLVSIPVATAGDRSTWTELVPESDATLRTVELAGEHLVLTRYRDACAEVDVLDLDGGHVASVDLPGRGSVVRVLTNYQSAAPNHGGNVWAAPGEFSFVFSTLTRSPAVYRYDIAERRLDELTAPAMVRDDLVMEPGETRAPDGATVRFWTVRRADAPPGPAPTLIYGYGGWNIAFVPSFMGPFTALVDAGGTFVLAHLRGGGEFGAGFWHDGRLARKQHTYDDLYAIGEALVERGQAARDRLAVVGASNGGLLTGVAVTQRPDLFRVVCSMVPLYDMLRYNRDSYSATCVLEYGDPEVPEQAAWMHAYSPYHNVRQADYPATLIYCGANDMRCLPWQARKLAARLQAANTGERPVLLRVADDAGHLSVFYVPDRVAEWLGFIMRELGLEPVPGPSGAR